MGNGSTEQKSGGQWSANRQAGRQEKQMGSNPNVIKSGRSLLIDGRRPNKDEQAAACWAVAQCKQTVAQWEGSQGGSCLLIDGRQPNSTRSQTCSGLANKWAMVQCKQANRWAAAQ